MLRAEQVLQMEERGTRLPAQNALSLTRTCLLPIFVSRPCLPTLWQDKYHGSGNDLAATEPWLRRTLIDNHTNKNHLHLPHSIQTNSQIQILTTLLISPSQGTYRSTEPTPNHSKITALVMARFPHMAVLERSHTSDPGYEIITPSSSSSSSPTANSEMVDTASQTEERPGNPQSSSSDLKPTAQPQKNKNTNLGDVGVLVGFPLFLVAMVLFGVVMESKFNSSKTEGAGYPGNGASGSLVGQDYTASLDESLYKYTIFAAEVATKTVTETVRETMTEYINTPPSASTDATLSSSPTAGATSTEERLSPVCFVLALVFGSIGISVVLVICVGIMITGFELLHKWIESSSAGAQAQIHRQSHATTPQEMDRERHMDLETGREKTAVEHGREDVHA